MKPYIEWTKEELVAEKARLEQEFAEVKAKGLNLNISRGKEFSLGDLGYFFRNQPDRVIIAGFVLTVLYIGLCIYASYRAKKNVTPEDPIHLVPHATEFHDRPRQNWKRSDTVFYHGPESRQTDRTSAPQENEREKELTGSHRK